eukprot:752812-Hanusia_phi.AAC.3
MCTAFLPALESLLEGREEGCPSVRAEGSAAMCCQKEDLEHSRNSSDANSTTQSSSFPSSSRDNLTKWFHFSVAAAAAAAAVAVAVADPLVAGAVVVAPFPVPGPPFCKGGDASCFRLKPPSFSISRTASITSRRSSTSSPISSPRETPSLPAAERNNSRRRSWWFHRNCKAGWRRALPSATSCRRATKSFSVGRRRRWKRWQRTPPAPSERRSERI